MPPKKQKAATAEDARVDGSDLDAERRERMARNAAALAAMGVASAAAELRQAVAAERAQKKQLDAAAASKPQAPVARKPRLRAAPEPVRRSHRIAGKPAPAMVELDDDGNPVRAAGGAVGADNGEVEGERGGLLDLMAACGAVRVNTAAAGNGSGGLTEQQRAALDARRVMAKGRGVYDKNLGVTCHFCRQKTLCSEPNCPRCFGRDAGAACTGKTSCGGCQSATGIFCRACLRVRYGQDLDQVRSDPSWRCPHCFEKEAGDWRVHGWFCNSSICMRHEGRMPTGIAIHEALDKGYASVAHMLQAAVLALAEDGGAGRPLAAVEGLADRKRVTAGAVAAEMAGQQTAPAQTDSGGSGARDPAGEGLLEAGEEGGDGGATAAAAAAAVELGPSGRARRAPA